MAKKLKADQEKRQKTSRRSPKQTEREKLDQWLDEVIRKYDHVLRRLADADSDILRRVRKNIERFHSALERMTE